MESDNVHYLDEYPHLRKKVEARQLGRPALYLGEHTEPLMFPIQESEGEDE